MRVRCHSYHLFVSKKQVPGLQFETVLCLWVIKSPKSTIVFYFQCDFIYIMAYVGSVPVLQGLLIYPDLQSLLIAIYVYMDDEKIHEWNGTIQLQCILWSF